VVSTSEAAVPLKASEESRPPRLTGQLRLGKDSSTRSTDLPKLHFLPFVASRAAGAQLFRPDNVAFWFNHPARIPRELESDRLALLAILMNACGPRAKKSEVLVYLKLYRAGNLISWVSFTKIWSPYCLLRSFRIFFSPGCIFYLPSFSSS